MSQLVGFLCDYLLIVRIFSAWMYIIYICMYAVCMHIYTACIHTVWYIPVCMYIRCMCTVYMYTVCIYVHCMYVYLRRVAVYTSCVCMYIRRVYVYTVDVNLHLMHCLHVHRFFLIKFFVVLFYFLWKSRQCEPEYILIMTCVMLTLPSCILLSNDTW